MSKKTNKNNCENEELLNEEKCTCNHNHKHKHKDCNCEDKCHCDDNCTCGDECECENCNCQNNIDDEAIGYLELAQRIQADFENYKRRNAEVEKNSFNNGVYAFVSKLLPVMDSFKQARNTIKDENALKGLELIHSQIVKALSSFGIYKIECVGQKFDPNLHNAVLTDCDETKEDEIILEELQEGFKTENKVIRHSVVKINKL